MCNFKDCLCPPHQYKDLKRNKEWFMFCFVSVFAFGERFMVLLLARSLQGIASACISVSGRAICFVFKTLQLLPKIRCYNEDVQSCSLVI